MTRTFHCYADTLHAGYRLAPTQWESNDTRGAVAATLRIDDEALILMVITGDTVHRGFAPAGISA
jgi:hypothetical protein